MIKRIIQFAAGCVLVIFVLVALIPTLLSLTPVRNYVLNKVNSSIHGSISVSNLSLGWFSGVQIENLRITDPEHQEVISIKKIDASGSLITLITNPKAFGQLVVDDPACTLIKDEKGISLERIFASSVPAKTEAPEEVKSTTPSIYLAHVKINNGSLALIEAKSKTLSIQNIQAEISLQGLDKALVTLSASVIDNDKTGSIDIRAEAHELKELHHWYKDTLNGKQQESSTKAALTLQATVKDLPFDCVDAFITLGQHNARGILSNAIGSPLNSTFTHILKDNTATTQLTLTSPKLSLKSNSSIANNMLTFTEPSTISWQLDPSFFNLLTSLNPNTKHITLTAPSKLEATLSPVSLPLPLSQAKAALSAHLSLAPLALYDSEKKLPLGTCSASCDVTHNPTTETLLVHAIANCNGSSFTSDNEIKLNGTKPFLNSKTSFCLQTQPLLTLANLPQPDLLALIGQQIQGKLDITLPEENDKNITGTMLISSDTFDFNSSIQKQGNEVKLPFIFTYENLNNPLSQKIATALKLETPLPLRCTIRGDEATLNLACLNESRCNVAIEVPSITLESKEYGTIHVNSCKTLITKKGSQDELKTTSLLQLDLSKASTALKTFIGPSLEISAESHPFATESTLKNHIGTHTVKITSQNLSGSLTLPGKYGFTYTIPKELLNLYITMAQPEYPYVFEKALSVTLAGDIGSTYPVTSELALETLYKNRTSNVLIPSSARFSSSFKPYTLTGSVHSLSGEATAQSSCDATFTWDHMDNLLTNSSAIGLLTFDFKTNSNIEEFSRALPAPYKELVQLCGKKITASCSSRICEPQFGESFVECDLHSDVATVSASVVVTIDPKSSVATIKPGKKASQFLTLDASCSQELWQAIQKSNLVTDPLFQKLSLQKPIHAALSVSTCTIKLPLKKTSSEAVSFDCKASLSMSDLLFQDSKSEQFGLAASRGTLDISDKRPLSIALISEKSNGPLASFSLNMNMPKFSEPMKEHQFSFAFENVLTKVVDFIATKDKDNSMAALFGPSMNGSINGTVHDGTGTYTLRVNTPTLNINGNFLLQNGTILLKDPFTAALTVNREQGKTLCHHFIPNITSCLYSDSPMTLTIQPNGFAVPITNFAKDKISISNIRIDLNKIMIEKTGTLDVISTILRLDTGKELSLWATPIYGAINHGVFTLQRFDALVDRKIQIAAWGNVDYAHDTIDVVIGILGNGLSHVMDLQSLPPNFVLQLPLKGRTSYATINKQAAVAKIASLKMMEIPDKNLAILGGLIQAATKAASPDAPVPPPTTQPFPWETR